MTSLYAAFVQEHPQASPPGPSLPATTLESVILKDAEICAKHVEALSININAETTKSKSHTRVSFSDRPIEYASSSTDIDDDPPYSAFPSLSRSRYRSNSEQSVDSLSSERTMTNTAINATTSAAPFMFIGGVDNNLHAQFEAAAIDDGLVTTNDVQRQSVVTIQTQPDLSVINEQSSLQIWEIQEEKTPQQQLQQLQQQQPQQPPHQTYKTKPLKYSNTMRSLWYRLMISSVVSILVLTILASWFAHEGSWSFGNTMAFMDSFQWQSATRSIGTFQPKHFHHRPSLSVLPLTTTVRIDENYVISYLYWLKQQMIERFPPFNRHRHRHKTAMDLSALINVVTTFADNGRQGSSCNSCSKSTRLPWSFFDGLWDAFISTIFVAERNTATTSTSPSSSSIVGVGSYW